LRFPEFSGEWETTNVGNHVKSISSGKSKPSNGNYHLYGSTGIIGTTSNADYIGKLLLVARVGANAGKLQLIDDKCGITDNTLIIQAERTLIDYLYYYLQFYNLNRLVFGSGQPLITGGMLKKVVFKYGSIQEQGKIIRTLSLIDKRISTQIGLIDKLQSLINGLVVTHYKQSKHCNPIKISELGVPFSTMNLSKEQLSASGRECIIYGELFTLYDCVVKKIYSHTNITSGLTLSSGRDLLFPASTTVDAISLIAPSALLKKGVVLGGDMFGINVSEGYSVEYLSYFFNYVSRLQLAKYAQGSTIIHLHYNDIADVQIALPALEEQENVVRLAQKIREKTEIEIETLHCLQVLKKYLLSQMFI